MSSVIRDLWPDDIKSDDVISPEEILKHQASQLESRTNGLLVGEIEKHYAEDRITLGFEVKAPLTDKRVRLLEVHHRVDYEYPVAIQPPNEELPDYLKERVYWPGPYDRDDEPDSGYWTENEWVASSPTKFTKKVEELFARPTIKAIVLSLLSSARQTEADDSQRDEDS